MVTRKEVAEKAGVSPAIVSRVINKSGYVAEEKRKKVLKVIKKLGYNSNPVAVSLKKNRTKQILYFVKDLSNNYFREMYKGMAEYASTKKYIFVLAGYIDPHEIGRLMVDGIIFPNEDMVLPDIIKNIKVPYVTAGYGRPVSLDVIAVNIDTKSAIDKALNHLGNLGHKKIAYACPYTECNTDSRLNHFLKMTHTDRDSPYLLGEKEEPNSIHDVNHYELGLSSAVQYIERDLDATSVVCFNDDIAIGLMCGLQQHGIRIPQDVSVVGIDGLVEGCYTSPPLTSVSLDMSRHGKECARVLIAMIEGKDKIIPDIIPSMLIERKSTSPI